MKLDPVALNSRPSAVKILIAFHLHRAHEHEESPLPPAFSVLPARGPRARERIAYRASVQVVARDRDNGIVDKRQEERFSFIEADGSGHDREHVRERSYVTMLACATPKSVGT